MMSVPVKAVALVVALSLASSYLAATVLKSVFEQPRPCASLDGCPESFSFPSRHTVVAFSVAFSVFLYTRYRPAVLLFLAAGLVGIWRLYIGVHNIGDVLGGAMIGAGVGIIVWKLSEKTVRPRLR